MKLTRLMVLGALSLSLSGVASAASLAEIKNAGAIRIGTEGTYAPFTFHEASGELVGFDVEIGRAIAAKLGVKAEFVEGKWDGLIAGIDAKRYDLVINQVSITPERQAKYDFSAPYIVSKAVVLVRNDDSSIQGFADLKGKKAAQSLTSNFGKLAASHGAELVATDGFNQSVELVLSRRADATINDSLSYLDFKKHKPDAPLKIAATQESADSAGVLLAKGQPELLAAVNQALTDIKADGTYLKIADKYFGADVSK
ncbi:amino acid ABC transporter substrate-binding protein [Pseudaeromonas sharmana]|uniref:Amino acid ABC transporter substrate-binding protein n=1 Tax=Pseudaeromonas sharmana TaxID=328412 RepID=A0ABV8CP34_9GAMM